MSKLRLQEMGSRYAFIVLYVWLEHHLSRGDYRRRGLPPRTGRLRAPDRGRLKPPDWGRFKTANGGRRRAQDQALTRDRPEPTRV